MDKKLDYYYGGFVGFLMGVFIIPTAYNLGSRNKPLLIALPLIMVVLFLFGVWLGKVLGKLMSFIPQFSRFVAVGLLNTAIDFGTLNIISAITGVHSGVVVGGINIPGFIIAVCNSYFWNKVWVFHDKDKKGFFADFPRFITVTLIGLLINDVLIFIITTYTVPFGNVNPTTWLNIAKAIATVFTLIWNFLGYKLIVFNRK